MRPLHVTVIALAAVALSLAGSTPARADHMVHYTLFRKACDDPQWYKVITTDRRDLIQYHANFYRKYNYEVAVIARRGTAEVGRYRFVNGRFQRVASPATPHRVVAPHVRTGAAHAAGTAIRKAARPGVLGIRVPGAR